MRFFGDPIPSPLPRGLGKWDRQGEYQPAVGVLLLTRGVDGDEGTGL